jgi:predicted acylesterase/phospholipase RssA
MAMPNPMKLQLALQGGGAKISALVACLEAVEALQKKNEIVVTRIAGTSAGAIVGTLFAAGVPMAVLKERLRGMKAALAEAFPIPGKANILWRLWWGYPLWTNSLLASELRQLLEEAEKQLPKGELKTLADISKYKNVHVRVVAASLTESGKVIYSSEGDDKDIVTALLDSCAIPYCFRTWDRSGNSVVVDGGICENLPSEELLDHVSKDGPVAGVSFARSTHGSVNSLLSFSKALLNTAMENSMDRAKRRLGEDLLPLQTKIGTFDFEKACSVGLEAEYDLNKKLAEDFFRSFVDSQRGKPKQTISGDPWKTENIYLMKQLSKIYEAQHASRKTAYSQCSLIVTAQGLAKADTGKEEPDYVHYITEFSTLETIYCRRVTVSNSPHDPSLQRTLWKVRDLNNRKEITAIDMPMLSPNSNLTDRSLLLFFSPPLPANSGPYVFDFQDLVDRFVPFADGKDDLIFTLRNAEGQVKRIDLVMFLPAKYPNSFMKSKETIPVGRPMTDVELGEYPAPVQFPRALGWRGENLNPDARGIIKFGVDVFLEPGAA